MKQYVKKGLYGLFYVIGCILFVLSIILLYGLLSMEDYIMLTVGLGLFIKTLAWQVKLWAYTPTMEDVEESRPVVQQVRLSEDRA
jgi:hypothetical protein